MPRVKFTRFGSSTVCGNFQPGDLFTGSAAFARHLVEELKVAEYVQPPAPVAPPVVAAPEPAPKPRRSRSK